MFSNHGRGGTISAAWQEALALALYSGHLGDAALDVTRNEPLPMDSPLLTCPNLTLAPHVGGDTDRILAATAPVMARAALQALAR